MSFLPNKMPQGWLTNEGLVLTAGSKLNFARPYRLYLPTTSITGNEFKNSTRRIFGQVIEELIPSTGGLQIRWNCSTAPYDLMLKNYAGADTSNSNLAKFTRNQKLERFHHAKEDSILRCEQVYAYCVDPIPNTKQDDRGIGYDSLIESQGLREHQITNLLEPINGRITALDRYEHIRNILIALNPDITQSEIQDFTDAYDPDLTIQENFWKEGYNLESADHIEKMGVKVKTIPLARWPKHGWSSFYNLITKTNISKYSIIANIVKADKEKLQSQLNVQVKGLEADAKKSGDEDLYEKAKQLRERARLVASGELTSLYCSYYLQFWATDEVELAQTSKTIKSKLTKESADFYIPAVKGTQYNLFCETFPGNINGSQTNYRLLTSSDELADFLPMSATFTGYPDQADQLFDGPYNSVVGTVSWIDDSPQHFVVFSMTGEGKSTFVGQQIAETTHLYNRIHLMDDGDSYATLITAEDSQRINCGSGTRNIFNYFDTNGAPLDSKHLDFCAEMNVLFRNITDPDEAQYQKAIMEEYIRTLYENKFQLAVSERPELEEKLAKDYLAQEAYNEQYGHPEDTLEDLYIGYRNLEPEVREELYRNSYTASAITTVLTDPTLRETLMRLYWKDAPREEFPQHSHLWERFAFGTPLPGHTQEMLQKIAIQLRPYTRNGSKGGAFDGVTNTFLDRKIIHWERSGIENDIDRNIWAFLATNRIRQDVLLSSPDDWSLVIAEELAKQLSFQGGADYFGWFAQTLRKYHGRLGCILQEFAPLQNSKILTAIINNSSQYYFGRLDNPTELKIISEHIPISKETLDQISKIKKVATYSRPEEKRADFVYYQKYGDTPLIGMISNFMSPELLWATSRAGDKAKDALKVMRDSKDPVKEFTIQAKQQK